MCTSFIRPDLIHKTWGRCLQVSWQKINLQDLSYWVILDKLHDSLSLGFPICEMGTLAYTKGLGPGQTEEDMCACVCMCT